MLRRYILPPQQKVKSCEIQIRNIHKAQGKVVLTDVALLVMLAVITNHEYFVLYW